MRTMKTLFHVWEILSRVPILGYRFFYLGGDSPASKLHFFGGIADNAAQINLIASATDWEM